ncbi:hypothetical protein EG68_06557 [Paragonimus skrjabini miyazakii]|uniref:Uncharacterized protein n=1 Tax=Paragonimus skrjabini miyazakii TaxID=59628 RepID=A0A8S9YTT2_9TREM|nr:hypothetical protein EG68_06557 [Paragonimus skrjabini miyazakii]
MSNFELPHRSPAYPTVICTNHHCSSITNKCLCHAQSGGDIASRLFTATNGAISSNVANQLATAARSQVQDSVKQALFNTILTTANVPTDVRRVISGILRSTGCRHSGSIILLPLLIIILHVRD